VLIGCIFLAGAISEVAKAIEHVAQARNADRIDRQNVRLGVVTTDIASHTPIPPGELWKHQRFP
jgi:hypothetical protein